MDSLTRDRTLRLAGVETRNWKAQPRDPGGKDGGQWIDGHQGAVAKVEQHLRDVFGHVETTVDWKGAHFLIDVKGTKVPVTISPLDVAEIALLFVPVGGEVAAAGEVTKVAQLVEKVHKALMVAKAAELAAHAAEGFAHKGQKAKAATRHRALVLLGVEMRGHPHPGQHYKHGWIPVGAAPDLPTGQSALDAVPAKLTPGPRGHFGDYEGESLTGPPGMGSVTALSGYEGVEYDRINNYLRRPGAYGDDAIGRELAATAQQHVTEIDKTMAASRLTHDVQVERVIKSGRDVFGDSYWLPKMNSADFDEQDAGFERWLAGERQDLTGLAFRDLAYVSSSADPRIDQAFGGRWAKWAKEHPDSQGEPVVMRIQVPKGTGAVQLGGMGEMGPKGLTDSGEVLLERGLAYEVTADHGVDADGFRRIDVKVVPGG